MTIDTISASAFDGLSVDLALHDIGRLDVLSICGGFDAVGEEVLGVLRSSVELKVLTVISNEQQPNILFSGL